MFPYRDRQTATTTFFCSGIRMDCPLNGMPCTGGQAVNPLESNKVPAVSLSRFWGERLLDHAVHGHMVAAVTGVVLWITRPAQEVIHGHLVVEATVTWSRRPADFCERGYGHFVAQTDSYYL
jgi:hypothetical protein